MLSMLPPSNCAEGEDGRLEGFPFDRFERGAEDWMFSLRQPLM